MPLEIPPTRPTSLRPCPAAATGSSALSMLLHRGVSQCRQSCCRRGRAEARPIGLLENAFPELISQVLDTCPANRVFPSPSGRMAGYVLPPRLRDACLSRASPKNETSHSAMLPTERTRHIDHRPIGLAL